MSEKSKNILLGVLIVGLVSMTVAYAALSTSLNISGTANVASATWDIRFENYSTLTGTGNTNVDAPQVTAALANSSTTKLSNVDVTLSKPGDKLVYQFDIVNNGTIDAKKATSNGFSMSITPGSGTAGNAQSATSYGTLTVGPVDYTVSCDDQANAVLTKKNGTDDTFACTLTVEYKDLGSESSVAGAQTSQTAGTNQTASVPGGTYTISADWTFVQN